jgi:hypothetical protein
MDNELVTKKNWWKINWKWLLALSAIVLIGIFLVISEINFVKRERENGIGFDRAKWETKNDLDYAYRNKMLKDLVIHNKLKKLKKDQIIALLGPPDRIDNLYLFYEIAQERIGFFPLHTTTLVIKLSNDGTENLVMIHE